MGKHFAEGIYQREMSEKYEIFVVFIWWLAGIQHGCVCVTYVKLHPFNSGAYYGRMMKVWR